MLDSDITVRRKSNTTQDFIKLKADEFVIYDAPGFMSNFNRENKNLSNYGQQLLEKQRLRAYYGLMEKTFKNYV